MEMYTEREMRPPVAVWRREEGSSFGKASNCLNVESILGESGKQIWKL